MPTAERRLWGRGDVSISGMVLRRGVGFCLTLTILAIGCSSQFERGVAFHNAGQYQAAIASYQAAIREEPGNEAAYRDLGLALNAVRQYTAASQAFGAALRLDPGDYLAHYSLGISLHYAGQYYAALQEFAYALRLNPGLYGAHYEIGELCAHIYQYQCAIAEFTIFQQRVPQIPEQRNSILRAGYQVRSLSAELALLQARHQAEVEAEEQGRIAAEHLQELENERAQAQRQAASTSEQQSVAMPSPLTPAETPSPEQEVTDEQQTVLAIVAAGSCEVLRRNGKSTQGQGDTWDQLFSLGEEIGGMSCRDLAVEKALERLFPQMSAPQRLFLKQVVVHVVEGDFNPSNIGGASVREEMVEYIKTQAPELEAPAQFANFLYDVYLKVKGE